MEEDDKKTTEQRKQQISQELAKLGDPKSKASKRNIISGVVLLIAMAAVVITVILNTNEIGDISSTFVEISHGKNYLWLILAIALTILFFLIYPIPLVILSRSYDKKASAADGYFIGASEHFYNGVTPFAAGGQPVQIYEFSKKGMDSSLATGLVLSNFMIYLIVLNAFEVLAFIFVKDIDAAIYNFAGGNYTNYVLIWCLAVLGYVFNLGFLAAVVCLGVSKRMADWLIRVAKWLCKAKWINKFLGPKIPRFESYCHNVQATTKALFAHKKAVAGAFLVKILVYALYFSLPYFILRSVGEDVSWSKFAEVGLIAAFASGSVCWVPTPGGTGGIEFAFAIAIGAIGVPYAQANVVALLWRMLTFYFVVILSFASVVVFESGFQIKLRKDKKTAEARKAELLEEMRQIESIDSPNESSIEGESGKDNRDLPR